MAQRYGLITKRSCIALSLRDLQGPELVALWVLREPCQTSDQPSRLQQPAHGGSDLRRLSQFLQTSHGWPGIGRVNMQRRLFLPGITMFNHGSNCC